MVKVVARRVVARRVVARRVVARKLVLVVIKKAVSTGKLMHDARS
jgi:hypothetical protein